MKETSIFASLAIQPGMIVNMIDDQTCHQWFGKRFFAIDGNTRLFVFGVLKQKDDVWYAECAKDWKEPGHVFIPIDLLKDVEG
jgi:hypothetical protein